MFQFLKDSYLTIGKKEKIIVQLSIVFILLLSSWSLIFGLIQQRLRGEVYTGVSFVSYIDRLVYFSQMEQARQEPSLLARINVGGNSVGYFSPFWQGLGLFSGLTGLSILFTFHLFRLIFGFGFLWLIYLFICKLFVKVKWRLLTFAMAVFGSGFGALTVSKYWQFSDLYGVLGTDVWVPEGYTFYSLMHTPLFILAEAMLLFIFWWRLERLAKAGWPEVLGIGGLAMFLGFIHPYDIVTLVLVLAVWQIRKVVKERRIFLPEAVKLGFIFLMGVLPIGYFYWLSISDKIFAIWFSSNITLSPGLLSYFWGYGLVFIFYLFGIYGAARSKNSYLAFLAVWSLVTWFSLYLPVQFQRRLLSGMMIPLAIIAVMGLIRAAVFLKAKWPKLFSYRYYFLPYFLCLLFITNVFILTEDGLKLTQRDPYPYFLPAGYFQKFVWLKENLSREEVILSDGLNGMLIGAFTAKTVYLGHAHQTAEPWLKIFFVEELFFRTNTGDKYKVAWLAKEGINYLWFSRQEDDLGEFNPWEKDYLQVVSRNQDVVIFKVVLPDR